MPDKIEGYLEVGTNDDGEIVINHPDLKPDKDGVGHIVFSPNQARRLAEQLLRHATTAEMQVQEKELSAQRKLAESVPVDWSARVLADGRPVTDDHREIKPESGQQKDYVVLSAAERAKGFVRPVRGTYTHKVCGTDTTMSVEIAETYARCPVGFYSATFCCSCRTHLPLDQFVWKGTDEQVGS